MKEPRRRPALSAALLCGQITLVAVLIAMVSAGQIGKKSVSSSPSPSASHGAAAAAPDALDLASALTLHQTEGTVFIDVRDETQWKRGHIKGAINLPANALLASASSGDQVGNAANIVVYCSSSSCGTASIAAAKLQRQVKGSVAVYTAGWEQWHALGLPHEQG